MFTVLGKEIDAYRQWIRIAVRIAELPGQIVSVPDAFAVGTAFTVIVLVAVSVPHEFVTITKQVVSASGVILILAVVSPVFQL